MTPHLQTPTRAQDRWEDELLETAAAALTRPGAVVLGLTGDGPKTLSRIYDAEDYETWVNLHRVVLRRAARLLVEDPDPCNYYVAIRYSTGRVVIWTGMNSVLVSDGPPVRPSESGLPTSWAACNRPLRRAGQ